MNRRTLFKFLAALGFTLPVAFHARKVLAQPHAPRLQIHITNLDGPVRAVSGGNFSTELVTLMVRGTDDIAPIDAKTALYICSEACRGCASKLKVEYEVDDNMIHGSTANCDLCGTF